MNVYATVWVAAAAFTVSACGGRAPVEINPDAQATTSRWNATLVSPSNLAGAVQVQGSGWMAAEPGDKPRTRAGVQITNAAPGGRHPWHVHRGQCGNDLGIFGPADAYKLLEVGDDGRAEGTAVLDVPFPTTGDYFVNVHASQTNMGTIVACGNLAPPAK